MNEEDTLCTQKMNCFGHVLYRKGIERELRLMREEEFIRIRSRWFERTYDLQKGDIICLNYNNEKSCQHAMYYLGLREGVPYVEHYCPDGEIRIENLTKAVGCYYSKLAWTLEQISLEKAVNEFISCYRRISPETLRAL